MIEPLTPEQVEVVLRAAAIATGRSNWMRRVLSTEVTQLLELAVDTTEGSSVERRALIANSRAHHERMLDPGDDYVQIVTEIANRHINASSLEEFES